jgi:hypothetical protein
LTSANNANPGLVMPNSILVPLGQGGEVSVYNFTGNVNLAVDLAGYTLAISSSGQTGPQGPTGRKARPARRDRKARRVTPASRRGSRLRRAHLPRSPTAR